MNPVFIAKNVNGAVRYQDGSTVERYLRTLPEWVHVSFKPIRNSRSNNQNRYFHGVVIPLLVEHTGYGADEMKDIVKSLFLKRTVEINGEEIEVVKGSSDLDTKEFEEFMESIRRWAATKLSLSIPEPNEVSF